LRIKARRFWWVTLSEHKWVILGERRGARISVVTKSGSSQSHGSVYWFHRHDDLNSNSWMNKRNKLPRNLFRFNDVGYTIGGQVLLPRSLKTTDKLFFFWSEEFQRQLRPNGANNRTVPTALERKGDFSQRVDNNGNSFTNKDPSTGSPFPGNVIPASSQYAPGIKLLSFASSAESVGRFWFRESSQVVIKGILARKR
jgi:hypothetical protein